MKSNHLSLLCWTAGGHLAVKGNEMSGFNWYHTVDLSGNYLDQYALGVNKPIKELDCYCPPSSIDLESEINEDQ